MTTEITVAEHLGGDVRKLDKKTELMLKRLGNGIEHHREEHLTLAIVSIDTLAIDTALREQVWRKKRRDAIRWQACGHERDACRR